MRRMWVLAALFGALLLCSCAEKVKKADTLYEAGDYAGAAASYEESAGGKGEATARDLYRMAVSLGVPASPVRNTGRATTLLQAVLSRYPKSPYAEPAKVFLAQLADEKDLREKLALAEANVKAVQDELAAANKRVQDLEAQAVDQGSAVEKLKARLAEEEKRASSLRRELEALKRIDLKP